MASNTMAMAASLFNGSHTIVVHGTQEDNGDRERQWHHKDQTFSVGGSVGGNDFEGDKNVLSNVEWKERVYKCKFRQEKSDLVRKDGGNDDQRLEDDLLFVESQEPLAKCTHLISKLIPYRLVIVLWLVFLAFFFRFRILTPAYDAYVLWITSVICEVWFAFSWMLEQFAKWNPINRETYLERLSIRFDREGEPNMLSPVDVYVTTVDTAKEPPLITANTVLSILAVDYPVDKICCYVSDDGASMLLFDVLSETAEFARRWVPFCKKQNIEPRAPELYFSKKIDYLKDKVHPNFVKERSGMKELPRLVYVSREKRPGYEHQKKAGAMNTLVRVSAVLTNAPFMLNLDCEHYINNSKAVREAMCFLMDPQLGKELCYVQFPQSFDGIDHHDRYANRNFVFFDINMRGLDGIQGPLYVGTGCVFNRQAVYGYDPPGSEKRLKMTCDCWPSWRFCGCRHGSKKSKKHGVRSLLGELYPKKKKMMERNHIRNGSTPMSDFSEVEEGFECYDELEKSSFKSQKNFEKRFGQSLFFMASTLLEYGGLPEGTNSQKLVREAIDVISCVYGEKTEWGKDIGWIYGSVTEDTLTGLKMHSRGWKSVYCMPERPAFKGFASINLSDRLHQVLRWALGSVEIFLSRHCPLCIWVMGLFLSIITTAIVELRWSNVSIKDWWRNEQFWVIGGVSAHLFAVFQGLLKVLAGVDTTFRVTSKAAKDAEFRELYLFKWTSLLIPPTTLIILNMVGVVAGVSGAI
ncbi:hypothetical protein ACFX2J_004004 [Malus domestica]